MLGRKVLTFAFASALAANTGCAFFADHPLFARRCEECPCYEGGAGMVSEGPVLGAAPGGYGCPACQQAAPPGTVPPYGAPPGTVPPLAPPGSVSPLAPPPRLVPQPESTPYAPSTPYTPTARRIPG